MAATATRLPNLNLLSSEGLKWYRSSDKARRGFCANCGSTLFWRLDGSDQIAIAAGTLDGPTGLKIIAHVFCLFAGDYYDLPEDIPHFQTNGDKSLVAID